MTSSPLESPSRPPFLPLALPPPPEDFAGDEVIAGWEARQRRIEAAGSAFFEVHEIPIIEAKKKKRRKKGEGEEEGEEGATKPSTTSDDEDVDLEADAKYRQSAKKKKDDKKRVVSGANARLRKVIEENIDLYSVLDLKDSASDEEIRKQYRRLALLHHPDKKKKEAAKLLDDSESGGSPQPSLERTTSSGKEDEEVSHAKFLLIQDAYEILSEKQSRRQYDSSRPFDNDIPDEKDLLKPEEYLQKPDAFFETFEPLFVMNARWSNRKPVPNIGDMKTRIERVNRFYEFWANFDSWRDFSMHDEYDLADGECREERRWMERENAKLRKPYMKEEKARIARLVELARERDPRVVAEKEAQRRKREDERLRRQREVEAEKERQQKEVEEKRRREEAELERQREEAKLAAEKRKADKQLIKKQRQRLRQVVNNHVTSVQGFANSVDTEGLNDLCLSLPVDTLEVLNNKLEAMTKDISESKARSQAISDVVNARIRDQMDSKKREELEKKEAAEKARVERLKVEEEQRRQKKAVWTLEELSALAKGLQKFPGGHAKRWQLIADSIGTKTAAEVIEKSKELSEGTSLKSVGSSLNRVAFDHFVKQNTGSLKKIEVEPDQRDAGDAPSAAAAKKPQPPPSTVDTPPTGDDDWTKEQQAALEKALAKYPASMGAKERWAAISKDVQGRTPKQCLARFKEIRSKILAAAGQK